jgi:peptidyl-prolyl cis-trans isomerase C
MIQAPGITVNGVKITIEQINAEVQYHPAPSLQEAKHAAMQALVIRELLIQQAVRCGLYTRRDVDVPADEVIDKLLEKEISAPSPTREECERYYKNNTRRFRAAPLFEVSHILYPAPPDDEAAYAAARTRATESIAKIKEKPHLFADIARAESACPSGKQGGNLGQISPGQTVPAFEAALLSMKEGDLSKEPVATEVGHHVILMHRRIDGKTLPFDAVEEWIRGFLKQQSWQRALSQYIQILSSQSEISGFLMKSAESPLVQ